MGTHLKHLSEALLMSIHNICFHREIRKILCGYPLICSYNPCSLFRVFADRMCPLQPPVYLKRNEQETLPYSVDEQADLSLCWSHRSCCRFCCVLAQISYLFKFLVRKHFIWSYNVTVHILLFYFWHQFKSLS